jgi:hypothetical protein
MLPYLIWDRRSFLTDALPVVTMWEPLFFLKEEIMFQFNYKHKFIERVKAKCNWHPR